MKLRRRVRRTKRPSKWTINDWERAWEIALHRLEGAPPMVIAEPIVQEFVVVLDDAFTDGNSRKFELGLIALLDFCAEAVNRGDCSQWW